MTAELMPFTYEGATVRTVIIDGEPWFVARDICNILGLPNLTMALQRLASDEKGVNRIDTPGGPQDMAIVSESGMYALVLRSDKPEAVKFRRWITTEVLPAIRKTGGYGQAAVAPKGEELLALAVLEAKAMLAEKDERIAELEPKAEVADKLLDADGDLEVADVAKVLNRAGIHTGRQRLFAELERMGWIYRHRGDGRWRIYQSTVDAGYMLPLPQSHYHPKTGDLVLDPPQVRVRPKGIQKLLRIHGGVEQLSLPGGAS